MLEKYGIFTFLAFLFVFSSIVSPAFLRPQNLINILNPAAALGIVAIGQTFVILTGRGSLDLSVASVMATVAVIVAMNSGGQDSLLPPIIAVCLLFGIFVGLLNGLLITRGNVPPIMATLGMMVIIQGVNGQCYSAIA